MPFYIVHDYPGDRKPDAIAIQEKAALFGPRPGAVSIAAAPDGGSHYEIRMTCPAWKKGRRKEAQRLSQCYERALALALEKNCETVVLPLMAKYDPDFPDDLAKNIALNAVREFLAQHEMQIYLQSPRGGILRSIGPMERDLQNFIDRNYRGSEWNAEFSEDLSDAQTTPLLPPKAFERRMEEKTMHAPAKKKAGFSLPLPDFRVPSRSAEPAKPPVLPPAPPSPIAAGMAPAITGALPDMGDLKDLLEHTDEGFSQTLLQLIDATGKKDSEIYNKANVSRQHFSKIRNNRDYRPTKATAVAFAIALELDLEQTQDLIGRAGYVLNKSSKFDVIIMYFIRKRYYNMYDINATLFEMDQSLLGA